jgi:hypothetical protein
MIRHRSRCLTFPALLFLLTAIFPVSATAQHGVETIFVLPGSHLDVGFTDTPLRVLQWRAILLDDAIHTAFERPDFYWFEESALAFDAWWSRNQDERELLDEARGLFLNGQLGVGATWVTPVIAARPEALPALTFHLEDLEREFDYRPAVAVLNDVPSFPESLVDALAGRGIRYLLNGANMFISNPLPAHLVRRPFWWESANGARVLTYIDPGSYIAAFSTWGIDPGCAKVMEPERFPAELDDLRTMERGIYGMLEQTPSDYDAIIIQHAFDNWDAECAKLLPAAVALWNSTGRTPRIVIAQPEVYFRHIKAKYGADLPVYRGELDSEWDHQPAAMAPVWTWRLRQAAQALDASAPRQAREALATALDHNLTLGSGASEFAEWQVRAHSRQTADIFRRAVRQLLGEEGVTSVPATDMVLVAGGPIGSPWTELTSTEGVQLRVGERQLGPWVKDDARLDLPIDVRADGRRLTVHTDIDRNRIPGSDERFVNVVLDIPLLAPSGELSIAPLGSASATEGRWLRGRPPRALIAPHGLLVHGLSRTLQIHAPLIQSWTLLPHPDDEGVTLLRALVVAQSTVAELRGGRQVVLPFEVLFPGEPPLLEIAVEVRLHDR